MSIETSVDGGLLISGSKYLWLTEVEEALELNPAFAGYRPEWRRVPVRHSVATLLRQRIIQIACGYEDQDDARPCVPVRTCSWSVASCHKVRADLETASSWMRL